jgi:hypothetical protein
METIKCVVVGDGAVGKFFNGDFFILLINLESTVSSFSHLPNPTKFLFNGNTSKLNKLI